MLSLASRAALQSVHPLRPVCHRVPNLGAHVALPSHPCMCRLSSRDGRSRSFRFSLSSGKLQSSSCHCRNCATEPTDFGRVLSVSAGQAHTCAVQADGQLVCFGDNYFGQCDVPADLGPVLTASAGYKHTCAVPSSVLATTLTLSSYITVHS